MENLKLYVWEHVLCDYTCGMAVVLAPSLEEAMNILKKDMGLEWEWNKKDFDKDPIVVTSPAAFYCGGGG